MAKNVMEFDRAVKSIIQLFRQHSIHDVATALFVSSLWLPNISSAIKHQLLVAIFASLKPTQFWNADRLVSYDSFRAFLTRLYSYLPAFRMLEDYVPETDWGEIRFHHEGRNYKIFYGNELENVYDFLSLFQLLYRAFDQEYRASSRRSPMEELQNTLVLQDAIISGITTQPLVDTISVDPGHFEIPPAEFWKAAHRFYYDFDPSHFVGVEFVKRFTVQLGEYPKVHLDPQEFISRVAVGQILPCFFITHGGHFYPILPRRYSSILFDTWASLFQSYGSAVTKDGVPYEVKVGEELLDFILERVNRDLVLPFVSASTSQGEPHSIVFAASLASRSKLFLAYIVPPNVRYSTDCDASRADDSRFYRSGRPS